MKILGRVRGFSLIELMVVMALMAVVLGIGAPAFVNTIKNNRQLTEVYALRATLSTARSEALSQRMPVIVCESTDASNCATDTNSWSSGYLAFADADADGVPDPNEILLSRQLDAAGLEISFFDAAGSARSSTQFSVRGDSRGQTGTFVLCDDRRDATQARVLHLVPSGEVRAAKDTDDPADEILNDLGGNNVACPES